MEISMKNYFFFIFTGKFDFHSSYFSDDLQHDIQNKIKNKNIFFLNLKNSLKSKKIKKILSYKIQAKTLEITSCIYKNNDKISLHCQLKVNVKHTRVLCKIVCSST